MYNTLGHLLLVVSLPGERFHGLISIETLQSISSTIEKIVADVLSTDPLGLQCESHLESASPYQVFGIRTIAWKAKDSA